MVCPHTETYSALIVFTSAEKLLGDEEQSPTNRMVDKKLVPTNGNFCSLLALRRRFFSVASLKRRGRRLWAAVISLSARLHIQSRWFCFITVAVLSTTGTHQSYLFSTNSSWANSSARGVQVERNSLFVLCLNASGSLKLDHKRGLFSGARLAQRLPGVRWLCPRRSGSPHFLLDPISKKPRTTKEYAERKRWK